MCIGQRWNNGVRIVLFVLLREGLELSGELRDRIRKTIRENTTPRPVPAKLLTVPDIPRTRSGKIVELAVANAVHGEPIANSEALANASALAYFRNREALSH